MRAVSVVEPGLPEVDILLLSPHASTYTLSSDRALSTVSKLYLQILKKFPWEFKSLIIKYGILI